MNVVLYSPTGMIGRRILNELVSCPSSNSPALIPDMDMPLPQAIFLLPEHDILYVNLDFRLSGRFCRDHAPPDFDQTLSSRH
jgi:hypothetical protein